MPRLKTLTTSLTGLCAAGISLHCAEPRQQPNFLVIVCEDISPYLACYGDPVAISPNLDRFAKEAVLHKKMFTCVGVSAPSRYSLITGRYSSTDGANYMRAGSIDKNFEAVPPAGVKCFTEYLRAQGYYCTNNAKTDYQFRAPFSAWDDSGKTAHWKNRPEGASFYAVFNLGATHESQIWRRGKDPLAISPKDVILPPYYPDNDIVRHDMAVMYSNIALMDAQFQKLYDELKDSGELDNTIVIFYSDNGGPLPRGKREIMDSGSRVPFMIRFPDGKGAGTINTSLNMFVDIPATILSLAGLPVPDNMHGIAMYGHAKGAERSYVFGATDRFDKQVEKRASIRNHRYLYIKNYMPEQSVYQPNAYRLQMPMMQNMLALHESGKLDKIQSLWFQSPADAESLYDCETDPHNIRNLAADPAHGETLNEMRKAFQHEWIEKYNQKWERYSENDFIKEMHPDGVKPRALDPKAKIIDGKLVVDNPKDGASISYRLNDNGRWMLYTRPVKVAEGKRITLMAERPGYLPSNTVCPSPLQETSETR